MIFTNRILRNEKLDKAMMLKFGSENRVQLKKTIKTCKLLAKWCKKRRNDLKTKEELGMLKSIVQNTHARDNAFLLTEEQLKVIADQHCAKVANPDSIFNPFTKG